MLKFSEIFEFSKEKFRKIPIFKEFEWFEWFEWFGPSPIEPFNSGPGREVQKPVQVLRPIFDPLLYHHAVEQHDLDQDMVKNVRTRNRSRRSKLTV